MAITVNDIVGHKRRKKIFAKMLNVTPRVIQELMDELLVVSAANSNVLSGSNVETWAEANTDSVIYSLLDWEDTEQNRIDYIESLLNDIEILISSEGVMHRVSAQ